MAELKKQVKAKSTTIEELMASEDKTNWEYVAIPELDRLGKKHPKIQLNGKHDFEPGQRYFLPQEIASEIKERLAVHEEQVLKLHMPNVDLRALRHIGVTKAMSEDVIK